MRLIFSLAFLFSSLVSLAWEPVLCPAVDQCSADRFETIRVLSTFEDGMGTWQASNGGQQPDTKIALDKEVVHAGQAALRVDATFTGDKKLEYINVGPNATIEKRGLGIGFWFRWEGTPVSLRMRVVDASGETHQFNLPRDYDGDPAKEWCYVATDFATKAGAWGGDGNGKLDYPCTFQTIVGDRPKQGFKGTCTLWLDDVAVVRQRKIQGELKVETDSLHLGNLYLPGESVSLRASGPGDTISWEWQDFFGNVVGTGKGPATGAEFSQALAKSGYYQCTISLHKGDGVVDRRVFRCAALPDYTKAPRNGFVGFCVHFQRTSAWPSEGIDLFARYGFGHMRDELSWGGVEQEKGKLALSDGRTEFLRKAKGLGIETLLILDYANPHYDDHGFPNSDEAIAGFGRYSGFMAGKLAGLVDSWEVWNEWSGGCGMHGRPGKNDPENYAKLVQASYKAIKQANPKATVIGIGGDHSEHHLDKIEGMFREGGAKAMDRFSVHSYRYPRTPEESDLVGEILHVSKLAKDLGAPERTWITEIGWPTHTGPRGSDEFKQARMFVRTHALLWGTDVVDRVYWYDFKNDGLKREYNENNFGVVWHQKLNWAPKPAVVAASVFARQTLGGSKPQLWSAGDAQGLRLDVPGGKQVFVVWSTGKRVRVLADGVESTTDLMGNPVPSRGALVLDENPVYLLGTNLHVGVAAN